MFIMPTRGRPHNVLRLIDLCSTGYSWWVGVDSDDPKLGEYENLPFPDGWNLIVRDRRPVCEIFRDAFDALPDEPFYGFIGDDVVPGSVGWEKKLVSAAGDDGVAYGDDLVHGEKLATHPVIGGDLVREQGWLVLPGLEMLYADTVWTVLARRRGVLRYLPDVIMEHRHPCVGKAPRKEYEPKTCHKNDRQVYRGWKSDVL